MKGETAYNPVHFFNVLKGAIAFCLLLSMLSKPVAGMIFHFSVIEYELFENHEKENSEKKEVNADSEDEDQEHYSVLDSEFHSKFKSFPFSLRKDLLSYHLDIPVPPPDKC